MRVICRKIRHALYLYIKKNVEKVWGARYTLGARYLSKNTVIEKGVKGSRRCLFEALTRSLCGGTEKNDEKLLLGNVVAGIKNRKPPP